ncbi:MAG TPA: hypothetical protein VHV83_03715 [Armatimonadota bacterium]|nr:hypothetical protein [Armatimonadota bacterium]
MSPPSISAGRFAQHGVTPKGSHDELRLGWICERLLNSQANIREIAIAAGFTDLSTSPNFSKSTAASRQVTSAAIASSGIDNL